MFNCNICKFSIYEFKLNNLKRCTSNLQKKLNGMCPPFSDFNGNHNVKSDLSGFENILYS